MAHMPWWLSQSNCIIHDPVFRVKQRNRRRLHAGCGDRCEKRYNIKRHHDLMRFDCAIRDFSHEVVAVRNSELVAFTFRRH